MNENLKVPISKEPVWCCYESPLLFKERWEKLFRDFCDVEPSKFEPSKISELYDALKFDLLHNREYLEYSFNHGTQDLLGNLFRQSKSLFDIIGPHEYGIEDSEKLGIGLKNTKNLLKNISAQLLEAINSPRPSTRLYFTKESKVYCLLNVLLLCGLKTKAIPIDIVELDYLCQITFELYERTAVSNPEYSIRLGLSLGLYI